MKLDNIFKKLPNDWQFVLENFEEASQVQLSHFVKKEYESKEIYPQVENLFWAFELTPLKKVKVIILGQDPYHGEGQAQGLAFSVPKNIKIPPSLKNIFKELNEDLGIPIPSSGSLKKWAKQGVFLLNTVLTVEKSKAGSHRKKGWEQFSSQVIKEISNRNKNCVFILWGSPAQKFKKFINTDKHLILESVHPSPLSSYRGFFGSRPFSKANDFLKKNGRKEIDWSL